MTKNNPKQLVPISERDLDLNEGHYASQLNFISTSKHHSKGNGCYWTSAWPIWKPIRVERSRKGDRNLDSLGADF